MNNAKAQLSIQLNKGPAIVSHELSDNLIAKLEAILANYSHHAITKNVVVADIIIQQTTLLPQSVPESGMQMLALYGFWVCSDNTNTKIYFFHNKRIVLIVNFTKKIEINVIKNSHFAKKLNYVLNFCIYISYIKLQTPLMHGFAMAKNKNAILLFGLRGVGKTQLNLIMQKSGWQFISDDKFILDSNIIHRYQETVLIRDHHYANLPWLRKLIKNPEPEYKITLRKLIRKILHQVLPEKLLPNEDRLFNKGKKISIHEFFPGTPAKNSIAPNAIILISKGEKLNIQQINRDKAINQIVLLQRLANSEFLSLENFLQLYSVIAYDNLKNHLEKNLPDVIFYHITLPETYKLSQLPEEISQCLQSV